MTEKPDLIIFDCDGTLLDTEFLYIKLMSEQLIADGFPEFDLQTSLDAFIGGTVQGSLEHVEGVTGRKVPEDFLERFDRTFEAALETDLTPVEGVPETLQTIPDEQKTCVASNGDYVHVAKSLRLSGFLGSRFNEAAVFTADMAEVAEPKPAPDLFLHAARRMGASPDRTIVVEDSENGVKGAIAAGMKAIGLTASYRGAAAKAKAAKLLGEAGAFAVTDKFEDIPRLAGLR